MVGSMLSNFWAALLAFSLYFGLSFPFVSPSLTLIGASTWAIVFFLLTFLIRYLFHLVWQSPELSSLDIVEQVEIANVRNEHKDQSSEEIALVVKQMLEEDLSMS
jgi:hypothetical protein